MSTFSISFTGNPPKDPFIAEIAHEVRNPLANICLAVDTLLSITAQDSAAMCLDIIKRNSVKINGLITRLLTDEYNTERDTKNYSLGQLLDEVLAEVEDRITLNSIKVEKQYAAMDDIIFLNVPRFKIALTNIIVNALEAMNREVGVLTLITKPGYEKCIVEVKDNGCGISKENLDKMFKTAFTTKPGGLGFGLTIMYDILRTSGAEINVESEEGKGTTFSLAFDKSKNTNGTHAGNGTAP